MARAWPAAHRHDLGHGPALTAKAALKGAALTMERIARADAGTALADAADHVGAHHWRAGADELERAAAHIADAADAMDRVGATKGSAGIEAAAAIAAADAARQAAHTAARMAAAIAAIIPLGCPDADVDLSRRRVATTRSRKGRRA